MITTSHSNKNSKGVVLLPTLIMLMICALILLSLTMSFYTHILLTTEAREYLQCQKILPELTPKIENELRLNLDHNKIPDPIDQNTLLNNIDHWKNISQTPYNIHIYSQLIAKNQEEQHYVSLISIGDQDSKQRIIYELISLCTLAEQACHPLQWSTL